MSRSLSVCPIESIRTHITLNTADDGITACRTLESAQALASGFKNAKAISLDVNDDAALDAALNQADVVISLIPYTFHATVIKSAIRTKVTILSMEEADT